MADSARFTRLLSRYGIPEMVRLLDRYGNNFSAMNAFRAAHPKITQAEAGRMLSLAAPSRAAGRALSALPAGDRGRLNLIPVNRELFGDEPAGRRFQYNYQINVIDRATGQVVHSFAHVWDSAVLTSVQDILPTMDSDTKQRLRYYTELREKIAPGMQIEFQTELLSAQRRY